jgi:lipid A 4'-phosphatase
MSQTRHLTATALQVAWMATSARFMTYLRLRRTRTILVYFLTSSVLLVAFSGVDIRISRLFFDNGFYLEHQGWTRLLHDAVRYFIFVSIVSVAGIYVLNRLSKRSLCAIDGRKVVYLLLVLVLGAGFIVNTGLKDSFGRARPRDIEEFGGAQAFTPAFVISSECDRNCSFSAGDSAGAFFSLAFILAAGRKRGISTAAVGFGILVSASRIAVGAHFFSDTVVSFFVMLIVADALHYHMFSPRTEPVGDRRSLSRGVLVPTSGTCPAAQKA